MCRGKSEGVRALLLALKVLNTGMETGGGGGGREGCGGRCFVQYRVAIYYTHFGDSYTIINVITFAN